MKLQRLILVFISLIFSAVNFSGCASMNRTQKGAVAGAAVGGVAGGAAKGGKGAVIGAAGGALVGGLLGAYLDKRHKELSQVVETTKTEHGLMVTLKNDLLFDFNRTDLKDGAKSNLAELAHILAKYPDDHLEVAGYTDHIGKSEYNLKLSKERAHAVREYLVANGVKNQITDVGMGEIPGSGDDPNLVAKNRKVEIYIDVKAPPQASN
jgi:outer membrane protein OmpA-like peptidoglycan-associated protein